MKYIVPRVLVAPDETPTGIRKKVAQQLGVRVTSLHVSVLSRQWWRDNSGGLVSLCVEAETNEFIHNTAYFSTEPDAVPLPEIKAKLPPVIVGFGLRGVLTAYLLARMGLNPIVLEEGDELSLRNAREGNADLLHGEGGISVFSGMLFLPRDLHPTLKTLLAEEGITFEGVDAFQYLPGATIKSFVKRLHDAIIAKGGQIFFRAKYLETKRRFGALRGVVFEQDGAQKMIRAGSVVFCNGANDDEFFLGFGVESSMKLFNQFVYGKPIIDAKYPPYYAETSFHPKGQAESILMTGLPKATLLDAFSRVNYLGQAIEFNGKGKNALSFVGVAVSWDDGIQLMRGGYAAGRPYSIPYSTVNDFFFRRDPLKLGAVKPLDASHILLTSLNRLLGPRASAELERALRQFGKAFPYLLQEDALVGGLVLLRGKKDAKEQNNSANGEYFASVRAQKSIEFSAVANACLQAVNELSRGSKMH